MTSDEVVASARERLLMGERLGRDTPVEVIRLAGVEPAPAPPSCTIVVDLSEFDESAQAALRGYAEQGRLAWLLRLGLEAAESAGQTHPGELR